MPSGLTFVTSHAVSAECHFEMQMGSLSPHCSAIRLDPVVQELKVHKSNYKVDNLRKLIRELKCGERCTKHFLDTNSTDTAVVRGQNSQGLKCVVIKRCTLADHTLKLLDMGKFGHTLFVC